MSEIPDTWTLWSDGTWIGPDLGKNMEGVVRAHDVMPELYALRDLRERVIGFGGDDFTVMAWIDAHKHHKDEPYIGCCFCQPAIVEELTKLHKALEEIDGAFVRGQRVTYGDPTETIDRIRLIAATALGAGCPCVGTPDQEDCPHE